MRLVNFSRPGSNSPDHVGALWQSAWIDVTQGVRNGSIPFAGPAHANGSHRLERTVSGGLETLVPTAIEHFICTNGGLRLLEQSLADSEPAALHHLAFDLKEVPLRAPILRPQKLLGIGLNYRDHAEEFKIPIPVFPIVFGMYANAIVGPEAPIVIPPATSQVDYEAELGVVIGAQATRVPPEHALEYVAGYTIVHDVSARDIQFGDKQWTRGKSIDTFAPIGPCLVTQSELGDGSGLAIELRLNGRTMQKSNTSNLIFDVRALVSGISQTMTLEPGDVIATGTPSGVGYVRKPPIFLKPGDIVEIEIDRIGILRNPVIALS